MINVNDFTDLIRDVSTEETKEIDYKIGKISSIGDKLNILFDGETKESKKGYAYLSSYTPKINDRVLLARIKGSYVILGRLTIDGSHDEDDKDDAVVSVNGKQGVVVLNKSDVGLSNVENIKQASKTEFNNHVNDSSKHISSSDRNSWNNKVDGVSGKGLSTNDYTTTEKNKLSGISSNANNYTHPSSHSASMITESTSRRFVSDAEKSNWNGKQSKIGNDTEIIGNVSIKRGVGKTVIEGENTFGSTNGLAGVAGISSSGKGYLGTYRDGKRAGVYGEAGTQSGALAGYFDGDVEVTGDVEIAKRINMVKVSIGNRTIANGNYSMAVGHGAEAEDTSSVALGSNAKSLNSKEGVLGSSGGGIGFTSKWLVPGSFTVNGTKNFEMPHPKPEKQNTHVIRHGAVESPTAGDNLYRYTITSIKENDIQVINLPDYFIHLNKNVQIFVTPQGHFGNGFGVLNRENEQLEISCQYKGEYNVLVIGTRNDEHHSVQDWDIKGVEREIGESWTGETYVFEDDEIIYDPEIIND